MITEHDLLEAIAECNGQRNPTASTCLKLASFYTILDHMKEKEEVKSSVAKVEGPVSAYSFSDGSVTYTSKSEFGKIINGKSEHFAWGVMDELMETLHEMIPKLYDGVLNRLKE